MSQDVSSLICKVGVERFDTADERCDESIGASPERRNAIDVEFRWSADDQGSWSVTRTGGGAGDRVGTAEAIACKALLPLDLGSMASQGTVGIKPEVIEQREPNLVCSDIINGLIDGLPSPL